MNVCSAHGEEISYVSENCPACEEIKLIREEYEQQLSELELEADQLAGELQDIKDKFGVN